MKKASTAPRVNVTVKSFKELAAALHQADMDAAARLKRSRPMREANAKRATERYSTGGPSDRYHTEPK